MNFALAGALYGRDSAGFNWNVAVLRYRRGDKVFT